jgi:hypothetical protein
VAGGEEAFVSRFDDLICKLSGLGCESYEDLTKENRAKLVRLYFQDTSEWGDALCDEPAEVLDAFEHHDHADLGLAIAMRMTAYVRPHIDKQLAYKAMCRREQEELRA